MGIEFRIVLNTRNSEWPDFEPGLISKCRVPFIQMLLGCRYAPLSRKSELKNQNYVVYFCVKYLVVLEDLYKSKLGKLDPTHE